MEASPELDRLIIRLGGFHLAMSYMGSIGFIMRGSGIEDLWETVYAPNTVEHMLTGHANVQAVRSHFLSAKALTALIVVASSSIDEIKYSAYWMFTGPFCKVHVPTPVSVRKMASKS